MAEIQHTTPAADFSVSSAVAAATCATFATLKVLIDGLDWSSVTVPTMAFVAIELVLAATFFLIRPRLIRLGATHGWLKNKVRRDAGERSIPTMLLLSIASAPAIVVALAALSLGRWREGVVGMGLGASAGATIFLWRMLLTKSRLD